MRTKQLEMQLPQAGRNHASRFREQRRQRAQYWFNRMRTLVNEAPTWAVTPQWQQRELLPDCR